MSIPGAGLQRCLPSSTAGFPLLQLGAGSPGTQGHAEHAAVPGAQPRGQAAPAAAAPARAPRGPLRRAAVLGDDTRPGGHWDRVLQAEAAVRTQYNS